MKKPISCILALALILPLAGCWDMQEINSRMFLTGIGIDKNDDGYDFTFCSVEGGKYYTVTVSAPALPKAIRQLEEINSNRLDLEHLSCIVIGPSASESDFGVLLDYIFISPAVRRQCHIACARTSARGLMEGFSEEDSGTLISEVLEGYDSSKSGKQLVSANSLFISLQNEESFFLYELDIFEAKPIITGITAYSSDGGHGALSQETAELALLFVNGQTKGLIACVEIDGSTSYYSVTGSHCVRSVEINGDNISFFYDISISVVLVETEAEHPMETSEQAITAQLSRRLLSLAKECASYGGEVIFMQSDARSMQTKWYQGHREHIAEYIKNADITVTVNCRLEGMWVSK